MRRTLIVCLAQGLWIGRIPIMPGTFGSALGVLWLGALLLTGNLWIVAGISGALALACVMICEEAELILNAKDPGSVVLDEIIAIPFCYLPWLIHVRNETGVLPDLGTLFSKPYLLISVGIFVLFRVFDMVKPWPVKQVQNLRGGWGVTMDDLLAAVYVILIQLILMAK